MTNIEELQNKAYKKMSAEKKIKILGQFFLLASKLSNLNTLKYEKIKENRIARRSSLRDSQNS